MNVKKCILEICVNKMSSVVAIFFDTKKKSPPTRATRMEKRVEEYPLKVYIDNMLPILLSHHEYSNFPLIQFFLNYSS
jgi:hypothetical protein